MLIYSTELIYVQYLVEYEYTVSVYVILNWINNWIITYCNQRMSCVSNE